MIGKSFKNLRNAIIVLFLIILTGTSGFMFIEGWNFPDSLYMTIITITTTGFEEVHQLSTEGEIFTLILLMVSFGTVIYIGSMGVQILIESTFFRRKKMQNKIEKLSDHYIVCGFGRMGNHICKDLKNAGVPFVVIENNPDSQKKLDESEYLYDIGDASSDSILLRTGVKSAKGLVAVLSSDAENVFTTLSAKSLNPNIFVVARAIDEGTGSKLLKAGADRVVKPYELGGTRMAEILLRPGVMDFIDVVAGNKKMDIQIEEITVKKDSLMHKKNSC
jgi:voltage-gated potassium channel